MIFHTQEETLDPENWDEMKALGHRMLDDMLNRLETIREHQFSFPSENDLQNVCTTLPLDGEGEEKVYEIFRDNIMNYSLTQIKPIFWGVVAGTGSAYGMLASMLTSGVNTVIERKPFITGYIHQQVIDWIKELLDYPIESGGVIVGGGSEANFTGLAVARNAKAKQDMKTKGIYHQPEKMTLYCSDQVHECLDRSIELLGLGNEAMRWIPTDENYAIETSQLEKEIKKDKVKGLYPFCIIGNAGTVNSGAFDDFILLREIADRHDMWLHVDGAFGSWLKLSDSHRHLVDGIELADSLAVDLHKWMYMPYGIGCTLVRDKVAHYSTFVYGHDADYIQSIRDLTDDVVNSPHMLSLQLSRNNNSLKAYMLLRAYGKKKYCKLIQQDIDHIVYLASLLEREPYIELMAPVISNVVCFRYNPGGFDEEMLERLNRKIANDLWKINFWIVSDTMLKGKYVLRACSVNHRSIRDDFNFLVEELKRIGKEATKTINP